MGLHFSVTEIQICIDITFYLPAATTRGHWLYWITLEYNKQNLVSSPYWQQQVVRI